VTTELEIALEVHLKKAKRWPLPPPASTGR
jgi:hypothetical protein